jgi:rubredoxin
MTEKMARYRCVDPDHIFAMARGWPKNRIQAGTSSGDLPAGSTRPVSGACAGVRKTAFVLGD